MQGDRRDLYRNEYNALVLGKAAESNNLIQEKYITVSAEKKSVEEARAFFSRVGTDLTTGLSRMSSSVREITVNDRLRLLHVNGICYKFIFIFWKRVYSGIDLNAVICSHKENVIFRIS